MLSHNIEIENIEKQLKEVNEDINTIQNDIKESNYLLKLKELKLEQKQNLKTSLEKRLKELNENTHIHTNYMDSYSFDKRDEKYEINSQIINDNSEQINDLNNQINNSKSFLTKMDLKIQRKKYEVYNNVLNGKNIILEKKQRVYLAASRNVNKLETMPQNFLVSVNNIKLRNTQEKYETKIERTHDLELHQRKLEEEGHKIRSKFFDKAIEFYTKRDNKTRDKYQKLLQTKSEFLKIESARQFYESYDLTRNQERVLAGESLKHDDIINNIIQIDGQNYLQDKNGNLKPLSDEIFMSAINNKGNEVSIDEKATIITNSNEEHMNEVEFVLENETLENNNQTEQEKLTTTSLIENSVETIKNVGRYGKVNISKKNETEEILNEVIKEPIVQDNIIQFPNLNTEEYNKLVADVYGINIEESLDNEKGRAM